MGYCGVLALLLSGVAQADVVVVAGSCPSGYVAISCTAISVYVYRDHLGDINGYTISNDSHMSLGYSSAVPTPSINPTKCTYGGAVCAKICNP